MGKKMCEIKPGEPRYLEAVGIPRHYCSKCGRVARDEKFLCKPGVLPAVPVMTPPPEEES